MHLFHQVIAEFIQSKIGIKIFFYATQKQTNFNDNKYAPSYLCYQS